MGDQAERWIQNPAGREAPSVRPWVAGLMVVGLTAAFVFGLHWLMVLDLIGEPIVWTALLGLIGLGTLRAASRFRAEGSGQHRQQGGVGPVGGADIPRPQPNARRHRRFVPAERATMLHLRDGRHVPARIVDISIAGVAVEASLDDVAFLSVARVGSRVAGPVRQTREGAVFGFESLLDPQRFDGSFVL